MEMYVALYILDANSVVLNYHYDYLFPKIFCSFFQGAVVGTMTGHCRFYDIIGTHIFRSVDVCVFHFEAF